MYKGLRMGVCIIYGLTVGHIAVAHNVLVGCIMFVLFFAYGILITLDEQ